MLRGDVAHPFYVSAARTSSHVAPLPKLALQWERNVKLSSPAVTHPSFFRNGSVSLDFPGRWSVRGRLRGHLGEQKAGSLDGRPSAGGHRGRRCRAVRAHQPTDVDGFRLDGQQPLAREKSARAESPRTRPEARDLITAQVPIAGAALIAVSAPPAKPRSRPGAPKREREPTFSVFPLPHCVRRRLPRWLIGRPLSSDTRAGHFH